MPELKYWVVADFAFNSRCRIIECEIIQIVGSTVKIDQKK
jgi:hypothetical protein